MWDLRRKNNDDNTKDEYYSIDHMKRSELLV